MVLLTCIPVANCRLVDNPTLHCLGYQLLGGLAQEILARQPADRLNTDLQQDRHRKRRNPIQSLMPDSTTRAGQELAETSNIQ